VKARKVYIPDESVSGKVIEPETVPELTFTRQNITLLSLKDEISKYRILLCLSFFKDDALTTNAVYFNFSPEEKTDFSSLTNTFSFLFIKQSFCFNNEK